ncbi:MAG: Stage 0 DNA-binding protein [uncultured bacterium]|nr:MAG: Stage 0 DNA-binding protein [uncultured bacterium]
MDSLIPTQPKRKLFRKETEFSSSANAADRVWHIPLSDITPNPNQPRKEFSHAEMEQLVASIKKHGIMQPITVTEKEDGGYEIIAGERRYRASMIAELPTIPALVRSATEQEKLELGLIENIQRQDLNPIEEAFAYQRLTDEFGLTQQEIAEQVGKSRPLIANTIRLLDLPEPIQKALIDGHLSVGKARALLSLKDEKEQLQMYQSMMGTTATVREVEQAVAGKGQMSRKGSVRRDQQLSTAEKMIEDRLRAKVHISGKGEKGTIQIAYYSKDELKRLIEELS